MKMTFQRAPRCVIQIAIVTVGCVSLVSGQAADPPSAFTGSWKLESFERRAANGEVSYPYGKNAIGQISYDGQGHMSALIMNPDRTRFKAETPNAGTQPEKVAAFDTFLAYAGTYVVDSAAHAIVHRVEVSSYPNYVGSEQRRSYEFAGTRLILTFVNGSGNGSGPAGSSSRLVWVRAQPSR